MEKVCDRSEKPPKACVHRQLAVYEAIILSFAVETLSFSADLINLNLGIFEFIGLLRYRSGLKNMYHYTYYDY